MNKREARSKIEKLKEDFRKKISSVSDEYKRAIVREIDYQHRKTGEDLKILQERVLTSLRVNPKFKKQIEQELHSTEKKINSVWKDYFSGTADKEIDFSKGDFEKIVSAYEVDFPEIEATLRDSVKIEFQKAVRSDYSFNTLRSKIKRKDVGDAQAQTLANTSMAQFDNAMHAEIAQQAGVKKFLYDGALQNNSRPFCVERVGQVFTLEELAAMDNGQGLPVLYSLGGYNCTHFLTAVFDE